MDTNKLLPLLSDLAVFTTVVDTGSFTAAAQKVGVTPSAISRQISRLEDALGVKLLERTTRNLTLSEAGRVAYTYSVNMLDAANKACDISSSTVNEPRGFLRVAAPKAFGKQILSPLIPPFLKRYPQIKLHIKISDHYVDPISDQIDVIFKLTDHPTEGLVSKKLGDIRLVLYASKHYFSDKEVPTHPSDLIQHECVFLGENVLDNEWEFSLAGKKVKVSIDGRYRVNHTEMRLDAIKSGIGIGVLPEFAARTIMHDPDYIHVLPDWQLAGNYRGQVVMQFAQTKYMPTKQRVFVDYIVECFSKNPEMMKTLNHTPLS
ncbi:LysR family transcriptional regulator [Thaumasiovibrio sp. DFM-14]|uniref:LysR family transcriptional regulator n=1 Tax=Thaumasiovibrio sp. DFM-14 TaxID=3384792 RepID=UPI0039A0E039